MTEETKFKLSIHDRDVIAKKTIKLVNRHDFSDRRNGISTSFLRNLLDFINSPNITANQFVLFIKYQASRQGKDQENFVKDLLAVIEKYLKKHKIHKDNAKVLVIKEFIVNVVMGGTYRKACKNSEEIQLL